MRIIETDPETGLDRLVEVPDEHIRALPGQWLHLAAGLYRQTIDADELGIRVPCRKADSFRMAQQSRHHRVYLS